MTRHRIHITGASGSGTTTLGRALAEHLCVDHHDSDDFYWQLTDPPYQTPREREERTALVDGRLGAEDAWVISGSLCGWGDVLIPRFTVVVYLRVPTDVRMHRLRRREHDAFGSDILPGGRMHENHEAFLEWAARYETAGTDMRSAARHAAWLAALPCPVVRIEGAIPLDDALERVMGSLETEPRSGRER